MKLKDLLEKMDMESVDPEAHILIRSHSRQEQFEEAGVEVCEVEYHEGVDVWVEYDGNTPTPGFVLVPALVIG